MDRLFLDANVLFSAAYRSDSALNDLWSLQNTELVTSHFAAEEARRNLSVHRPEAVSQLETLLDAVVLCTEPESSLATPEGVELAEKDVPILAAAIRAECTHLVTGDNQHFGHLFGNIVGGVRVVTPAQYLRCGSHTQECKPTKLSTVTEELRAEARKQGFAREDLGTAIAEVRNDDSGPTSTADK